MDKALVNLTHEWLTKAFHDLQTARIVSTVPDGPLDTAIYEFVLSKLPDDAHP
jgi:hypothetical protein